MESTHGQDEKGPVPLRIAIIGAGIGGLTLAQLLKQNPRLSVTVYERGTRQEAASSLTGFRILLSREMLATLRQRLPEEVMPYLEKAVGTTPSKGQSIALLDQKGGVKLSLTPKEFREASSVSRWKLRTALLRGLDDIVKWETEFQGYEQRGREVYVKLSDGNIVAYNLVVGADGAGSKIRKQLLPDPKRDSLGITVLYFKMPLTPETELMMPFGTGCMVMAPRSSMVVSYFKDRATPYTPFNLESIDPEHSYLMCGLGCPTEDYVKHGAKPEDMSPAKLKEFWLARTRRWHPLFRSLIAIPSRRRSTSRT
ncbi:6-hydroxynicotinate 3-monooxygenase [Madurella fahalii]|uniref:6-hydroxynicotinate 3-monooxygenase n=1 Tax=Madurella fahalii TaxID=1157608 RepID=A0ABQ0GPQ3_9PEZI